MPPRSLLRSAVIVSVIALPLLSIPNAVQAQGLIDFLWGGSKEWGGGRQTIRFNPKYTPGQIIVSFGDRRLYLLTKKGEAVSYPIAVPREKSRWQGTTTISAKKENPSWRPTPEMLRENPKLPRWVPGGHPMNPLGVRALYLGTSAYRIHGTDAPWTIGQAVSQGCIRMNNEDVLDLFPRVPVNTRVTVTWERFTTDAAVAYNSDEPPYEPDNQPQPAIVQAAGSSNAMPPLPRKAPVAAEKTAAKDRGDDGLPQDFIALDDDGRPLPHKVKHAEAAPAQTVNKKAQASKADAAKVETAKKPEAVKTAEPAKKQELAKLAEPKVEAPKVEEPKVAATAKPEPAKSEPAQSAPAKAEPETTSAAPNVDSAASAAESARRAAEAAAKAAEMARAAAEAAKKAAADAKKATSTSSAPAKSQEKVVPGKSASL